MRPRFFWLTAATAAVLFGAVNLAVLAASRNTIPRQIARRMETLPTFHYLALGNSLMEAGFDSAAVERQCPGKVALNAGLGSSYPVEHLLLLRHALEQHAPLELVLYGFVDLQLMEPPQTSLGDVIGNRAMLYYFEPDMAARYYRWGPVDRLGFGAIRLFPALEERGTLWSKVERFRRGLGAIGMPAQAVNRFGRVQDFAAMEPTSPAAFARECDRAVDEHRDLSPPIADMVRLAQQHGARILMIEMPMPASHIERFYNTPSWQHYRAYLEAVLARHGAGFLDASSWVQNPQVFADNVHLSSIGAAQFSRQLGAALCQP